MRKNENENENFKFIEGAPYNQTGIKGIQNQPTLVTVQSYMPTLNLKKPNKQTNKQIKIQQVRQQVPQHWVDRHVS